MFKCLCLIFMAIAFVMFALPAASDGGGGYAAPAEMSATVGIDTSILDQAVTGALAGIAVDTPIEATLLFGDEEAAVLTGTGSILGEFGLYGYCRASDPTDPSPAFDLSGTYKHIDPGRTGSAGASLNT